VLLYIQCLKDCTTLDYCYYTMDLVYGKILSSMLITLTLTLLYGNKIRRQKLKYEVVHGYITDDLSFSTVLPIPKGKHLNYSDSANYRGIDRSSIIGKIYDLYVLSRYESLLTTSDLQFGFKI